MQAPHAEADALYLLDQVTQKLVNSLMERQVCEWLCLCLLDECPKGEWMLTPIVCTCTCVYVHIENFHAR